MHTGMCFLKEYSLCSLAFSVEANEDSGEFSVMIFSVSCDLTPYKIFSFPCEMTCFCFGFPR